MDNIDRKLINLLRRDAKMTIAELADRLNRTATPVYERIKRLEQSGVIQGYTAVIDDDKLGMHLTAFCEISLLSHEAGMLVVFEDQIKALEEVVECHHIAGSFDYLIRVKTTDMKAYQHFVSAKLAAIPHVGRVQSVFSMKEIKGFYDNLGTTDF